MALTILFLTLIFCCSCCVAQFTITQNAAMSGSPGESVRMSCSRSGGSVTGDHYPSWYLQTPGSPPKLLVYSSSSSNQNARPSGMSDRFSGSLSGGSAVLSISRLQPEDEGDYYCVLYAGSGVRIFGPGTTVSVLGGEVKVPTVLIFPPSKEEQDTNSATVVCTVDNLYPKTVTIEFTVDGQKWTNGVYMAPVTKSGSVYMGSGYLTMTTSDYKTHSNIACKVTHQGKEFVQTLKTSECI